jgi:succinoglycan biosynthesis transport protein ExoP
MSRNFEPPQGAAALSGGMPVSEMQGLLAMEPQAAEKEKVQVRTSLSLDQMAQEEVSKLVQAVFHPQEGPRRSVFFAAINSGSGCTWICSQIAKVLAATVSERVCIVDANFRTPSRRGLLGATNQCGLSDALRSQRPLREFVRQLEPQNLWLLPCGSGPEASVSLLTSEKMRGLVAELRREFGYVLMDLPPLSTYADGTSLGHLADGMVVVLEANVTRREVALQVADRVRGMKIQILGAVLNKRTFPIPESVYHRI